ncbi:cell division protein FtsQ/DivIB [Candidatus Omnitrophota bacterium]
MSAQPRNKIKKRKLRIPGKIISIVLLCSACVLFILFLCVRYLTTSDYFKIKDSPYFSGQNIFKVIFKGNLQKEAKRLHRMYPDYKRIILKAFLPDRIAVDFQKRRAVARLELANADFYLDEEGELFSMSSQENGDLQLPLITGLQSRIFNPRSGVKYNEGSLMAILGFINNFNKDSELSEKVAIKRIDLENANDVFLFTAAGCKINLGIVDFANKRLSVLEKLVSEIDSGLEKIEYIDLRFREPVIKYK